MVRSELLIRRQYLVPISEIFLVVILVGPRVAIDQTRIQTSDLRPRIIHLSVLVVLEIS